MTSNNELNSKTKQQELRSYSSFYTRHKKEVLDELKQSLSTPYRSTRHSSFDHSSKKEVSKSEDIENPVLSHYNNLDNFRDKIFAPTNERKRIKIRVQNCKISSIHSKFDSILEIIQLETLSKALKVLKKNGINDMTWAYKRQLRQFSIEILRYLKE